MVISESNPQENTELSATKQEIEPNKSFSLEILKLIKDLQQQHGLRHGDYQRYRGYCSRRIARLRKVLKLPQGDRRHFKRRDVLDSHLAHPKADERFLHIPLMLSERCWAYAMQLRQESNTEQRKKFHLVQKLRKACVYALQLDELCKQQRCDARTQLEAQAYVAWIQGSLQFELQLWLKATENLKKAQVIYEKLSGTLSEEEQLPYKQRVEEITPSLRYCAYNIGDEKAVNLLELRTKGVLENFDSLLSQNNQDKTEQVLHEIDWFGVKIPVKVERIRLFLLSIENLDESLKNASDAQARIKILENLFIDLRDVINLTRDSKQDLLLLSYLLSVRIERTSQRNLLLVLQARRPQDCVRLLDINIQQTIELTQNEAIKSNKLAQSKYEQLISVYKALRTYYIAKSNLTQKRFREAAVLYDLAQNSLVKKNQQFCSELNTLWDSVQDTMETDLLAARAHFVLGQDESGEVQVVPQKVYKSKKPLFERLDEFREEPQLLTKNPNLVVMPPAMVPVPAKPLFFDLALNHVQLPDLQEKIDAGQPKNKQGAGISGFVKGFLGWGNK